MILAISVLFGRVLPPWQDSSPMLRKEKVPPQGAEQGGIFGGGGFSRAAGDGRGLFPKGNTALSSSSAGGSSRVCPPPEAGLLLAKGPRPPGFAGGAG